MVEYTGDPYAFTHLVGLSDALTAELFARNLPELCSTGVQPGDTIAVDFQEDGCTGMSWVRLTTMFSSLRFPEQDAGVQRVVQPAFGIEMGIMRPTFIPDNGETAEDSDRFEETRLQLADMAAMLAVLCAYPDSNSIPIQLGTYTPLGPQGGAVGGAWTATMAVVF